jgi:hypothetical protein
LLLAAHNGYINMASLLFEHDANSATRNTLGWGISTYAIQSPSPDFLREIEGFTDHGSFWKEKPSIDVSFRSSHCDFVPNKAIRCTGCTPIHVCVSVQNQSALKYIARKGLSQNLHEPCAEGYSPLHLAAAVDAGRIALWLIHRGADVNSVAHSDGTTALHLAIKAYNFKMARTLLGNGARLIADQQGRTADMLVPNHLYPRALKMLRNYEVPATDLKSFGMYRGFEQLGVTISSGKLSTCEEIIERGDFVSSSERLPCGCTPLIYALAKRQLEIARSLVHKRAYTGGAACSDHVPSDAISDCTLGIALLSLDFIDNLTALLDLGLEQEEHWIWTAISPFHVAAVCNADALPTLIHHVEMNSNAYRQVLPQSLQYS